MPARSTPWLFKGKVTDIEKTLPESKDVTEDYAAIGIMCFN